MNTLFDEVPHLCSGNKYCRTCGEAAKSIGATAALTAKEYWRQQADLWFSLLEKGTEFTSEDMTRVVGLPARETGMNRNNAVGAYLRALASADRITKVGLRASEKVSSHGATLIVWKKH